MGVPISPSALRSDLYNILDRILETGEPVEITRKGRRLLITVDGTASRTERLTTRPDLIVGDPGDLAEITFDDEWQPHDNT